MRTLRILLLFCCMLGLSCGGGSDEGITVSEVTDDASLRDFVEYAAGRLQGSASFEEAMQLINEFRKVEGDWNDGSTYLVLLTGDGGVYIHAKNRKLEDQDWSDLQDAEGKNVGQLFLRGGEGGFIEYHGEDGNPKVSYAFPFTAASVPLTNPFAPQGQDLVLVGGFDYEPPEVSEKASYEQLSDSYNLRQFDPITEARYVDTREELKQFVEEAIHFFTGALALGSSDNFLADAAADIDVVLLRRIFRLENGPWRYGSTYIYIMDDGGNVVFNGANRNLEQTNLWEFVDDSGNKVIQRIIAAAEMPGGDFVEYNWNDPEDPNDDPPGGGAGGSSPKLGYAKAVRINKGDPMSPVYIFGSGLYQPELLEQPKEEPGR